ncbi:hypothetical protein [Paludibacterium sp.]|uniref:hypothetical protein n=1 Tax=Paludibacterium sp. TaxID=1917523 RepID=UPI0025E273C4|nr:hypothetical protein [Paludibacterium sp.]MBV8647862.1 hypothetical protein [Paludibacterium sp.]
MTLLMIWKEANVERIWLVSDSRLSNAGEAGGHTAFTDRAAKILEIPAILSGPRTPKACPTRSVSIGFAYTGSTLIALQAYTAVLPLWSRLETTQVSTLPSIKEFAEHLKIFMEAYAHEMGSNGHDVGCQCVLVGPNDPTGVLDAWLVETKVENGCFTALSRQLNFLSSNYVELLGSGRTMAAERLMKIAPNGEAWSREPLRMIRDYLGEDRAGSVGGAVQIGIATEVGCEMHFDVQPLTVGKPLGTPFVAMTYRGFDFFKIGRIGDAFITLRGIT